MQVASSVFTFSFFFLVVFRRLVFYFNLLTFEIHVRLPFAFFTIGVFSLVQRSTAIYHQYLLVSFFGL